MSQLLIKRKDTELGNSKLEYGEFGIAQNKLYFGGSNGKNDPPIEVALKADIPNVSLVDDTKLTIAAIAREDGNVLPVALDSNGNLAVRVPVIDVNANARKIRFEAEEWSQANNTKYGILTLPFYAGDIGCEDIYYTVNVLEDLGNNNIINASCVVIRDQTTNELLLYANSAFSGYLIITYGIQQVIYSDAGKPIPDIRFISFSCERITETEYREARINGQLTVDISGQLQVGDKIQLCSKGLYTNGERRSYRLIPRWEHVITANDISGYAQGIKTFVVGDANNPVTIRDLTHFGEKQVGDVIRRERYPLHLRIMRPGPPEDNGNYNIYSNTVILQPHFRPYDAKTYKYGYFNLA
jgi:hypothetical protein